MVSKSVRPPGRRHALRRLALPLLSVLGFQEAMAGKLTEPSGPVVLTLSGRVGQPNQGAQAVFDLAMLAAFTQRRFSVKTPWDPRPVSFEGPLLRDVLKAAEARGSRLTLAAVNDYKVEVPMEDLEHWDVVLALKMNGQAIPTRTKGPLFVVYPFDLAQGALLEQFRNRSIWQLVSIQID
ncbi:MAG: hypothetical protein EKK45_22625 [Curvibacter sp.]|nr:MAG: hypothetical protein EKK45_22625 [Curvibacter sp.]